MQTVKELQLAAEQAAQEHQNLARELGHQEAELAEINERHDTAGLDTNLKSFNEDEARLKLLKRSIAALRPRVQAAQEQAQAGQERAQRAVYDLQAERQRLDRLLACTDGAVLLMQIGDWRIMVQRARQRIHELSGEHPPEVSAVPPLPEVVA